MWTTYHQVRTSDSYSKEWNTFLLLSGSETSPIFVQYVSHFIFKQLIVTQNPVQEEAQSKDSNEGLTYEELNAVRYAAEWVARALQKKLLRSSHPRRGDLQLCLKDILDNGDEGSDESKEWLGLCDRGGLMSVNQMTFELFLETTSEDGSSPSWLCR